MRAYEIPGWLSGVRLRKEGWNYSWYISFNGNYWIDETGKRLGFHDIIDGFCVMEELFCKSCWELWQETYLETS